MSGTLPPIACQHPPIPRWPDSIQLLDRTLPSAQENLALDDVLLAEVDADPSRAIMRTWELSHYCVVLGRSNQLETEVNIDACRRDQVPVLRRSSGGGAVVLGPGCLVYSLALPLTEELRSAGVSELTSLLMKRTAAGLTTVNSEVTTCGTSDLATGDLKFSGNSQRWLKQAFLHHGTILYDFDLSVIDRLLNLPSREPAYRAGRPHDKFVTNLIGTRSDLLNRLIATWNAIHHTHLDSATAEKVRDLTQSRYQSRDWHLIPASAQGDSLTES